jgi:transposase
MMKRIGMPASDDTILRHLKRRAKERRAQANVRVVGIDDWAWRKGSTYGTIIVDLERREVIDLLAVRSAGATADWLKQHPDIEMISRDHCGSFAQGAHEGAPQARQVADRFHILQNLREAIQAQLGRAAGSSARPLLPPDGRRARGGDFQQPAGQTWRRRASLPHQNGEPALKAGVV